MTGGILILLSATAIFLPHSLIGINIFDEGIIAAGASLILDGKLPYRDFHLVYGPGQYYLTAALFSLFGEDLLITHVTHAFLLAALGLIIFNYTKQIGAQSRSALLMLILYIGITLFAQPNVGYPAITSIFFLLLGGLTLGRWATTSQAAMLAIASLSVGMAGLFRWDFGIYGLSAFGLSLLGHILQAGYKARSSKDKPGILITAFAPVLAILALVYVPLLVIYSSFSLWYHEVPYYLFNEFAKWRNLEFIRPAIMELAGSDNVIALSKSILKLAYLGLPITIALLSLSTIAYMAFRGRWRSGDNQQFTSTIYLACLCIFFLNQMRVRTHLWQGFPAMISSLPLIVFLLRYYKMQIQNSIVFSTTLPAMGFLLGTMLTNVALQTLLDTSDKQLVPFDTPRSSTIHVQRYMQPYIELVNYIRTHSRPHEAIYSGVDDHSRLFMNDVMLYFLADRPPPDRFLELEPGMSNSSDGQNRMIQVLQQSQVRLIVLASILSNEPNLTSRSNGVTSLDEFIRKQYTPKANYLNYTVYIKDPPRPAPPADLQLFQQALTLQLNGQQEQSILLYQQYLLQEPDYYQAHFNLAHALMDRGQCESAIPEFERTLELWPGYKAAHLHLANCYRKLGRQDMERLHAKAYKK